MRIQFTNRREAARFAAAVGNVTGRKADLTRSEGAAWRVHAAALSSEWAFAISSLLQSGVPCARVTLDQVLHWVESARWTSRRSGPDSAASAAGWALSPDYLTAGRGMRPVRAAAAG